ncbi:ribosome recycling factor [Pontibacillus halophilus JSM 076056 = DSM 19796]|uniref:Ribosome-recycling factor n=1 Tax=Pontibacillus halophilus JSM 076056 = DSM 19796 TaxID=1385510 RepID=A0A0A5GPH0_9BACI|nr:ribosome recycling factor [Pontibacillus halophilus]KGX93143.1 ribosome recycling factor [Pontibacillus halophilus JSM 076056 = DSM 19796]
MSDLTQQMTEDMKQSVQSFSRTLATVRAGRANPAILDPVKVDYYGMATPLNQLASISTPEARLLVITPFDKSAINEIEKAIQKADLGLSPSSDGTVVRINIPALNEERRKDLVKLTKKYAEEAKVQIRNIRRDTNDALKKQEKDGDITEDDLRNLQDDVQKATDKHIADIDELAKNKEQEIMEV